MASAVLLEASPLNRASEKIALLKQPHRGNNLDTFEESWIKARLTPENLDNSLCHPHRDIPTSPYEKALAELFLELGVAVAYEPWMFTLNYGKGWLPDFVTTLTVSGRLWVVETHSRRTDVMKEAQVELADIIALRVIRSRGGEYRLLSTGNIWSLPKIRSNQKGKLCKEDLKNWKDILRDRLIQFITTVADATSENPFAGMRRAA